MAEKEILNLTKLDGQNFPMWKFGLTLLLESQGLTEFIDGSTVEPNRTEHPDDWARWKKSRSKAAVIIMCSVEQALHVNLINCDTPDKMWTKLNLLYGTTSEDEKQSAWQKFYEFRIKEGESIVTKLEAFESLCKTLENAGETVSETAVMSKLLSSLPQRFSTFSMAWECTAVNDRTKDNLIARIIREDKRQNDSETTSSVSEALSVKASASDQNKEHSTRNKHKNIAELKKNTKCNYCHMKGHWARECRKRLKKENQQKGPESTYVCDVSAFYSQTTASDEWIADSGASMHMTSHREYFREFVPENDVHFVKIADNKTLSVEGVGRVDITVKLKDKVFIRHLSNVLYVPDLKRNLFSIIAITERHFSFHCFGAKCEVREKNGALSATGTRHGNLFYMDFQVNLLNCTVATVNSLKLWHERFGHVNVKSVKDTIISAVAEKLEFSDVNDFFCEICILSKQTCKSHPPSSQENNFKVGEKIHTDVCGPIAISSPRGSRYFLLFKDECSGFRSVYFMQNKSEVLSIFKEFETLVFRQTGNRVKVLHSDNGTEYVSAAFKQFLKEKGIIHETSSPYIHQQNGRAEREIRSLVTVARSMLIARNIPTYLWTEAVKTASYLLNRVITSQSNGVTAYGKWFSRKPQVKHLRIFGCDAYMHVPKERQVSKYNPRSKKLLFVGYDGESKNYRLFDVSTQKIYISSDVDFNELDLEPLKAEPNKPAKEISLIFPNIDDDLDSEMTVPEQQLEVPEAVDEDVEENEAVAEEIQPSPPRLRDRNQIHRPSYLDDYAFVSDSVPLTYDDAISCSESTKWKNAMLEELKALDECKTWILTELPPGRKPIGSKWVYVLKTDNDGNILRYKARLVAKGFSQREGIDYLETFAPVVRYESVRVLLSIAAKENLEISKFDVKTAFLNGDLQEEIYMELPPGIEVDQYPPNTVCKLQRSLYGLKQSPRCWNSKFVQFLNKFGFTSISTDTCVFIGDINNNKIYLVLYVDDGLLISKSKDTIAQVMSHLKEHFQITIDKPNNFVGLEIERNREKRQIKIGQRKYIKKIIEKFNLNDAKPSSIPADPGLCRNKSDQTYDDATGSIPYREAVGSLLFAARVSRPDIEFSVNRASQFLTKYGRQQWLEVKNIIRYLKGTLDYGIVFSDSGSEHTLVGYTDADYAGCIETRKSTSGFVFMLNGGPIAWSSQRQPVVSLSTTEAEYIALAHGVKECIWLKRMLTELGIKGNDCIQIFVDNQSAIRLANNPEFHKRSKHIDVRFHFVRDVCDRGDINIQYIQSKEQLADLFTKPLAKGHFRDLRDRLSICGISHENAK